MGSILETPDLQYSILLNIVQYCIGHSTAYASVCDYVLYCLYWT